MEMTEELLETSPEETTMEVGEESKDGKGEDTEDV